jgi:hypothetical protein
MDKVKVLFLAANPDGTSPLKLDEEIRQITAKVRASEHRDSLELVSRWAVRPDDVLQALLEVKPHVVHFSGHGNSSDELILHDNRGNPKPVGKDTLVRLFRILKDNVRLVVFNACSTKPQAEALAQVIDCVIGMNQPVGDEAGTALSLEGIPEEDTPELMTRHGVDAATLVLVSPSPVGVPSDDKVTSKGPVGTLDAKSRSALMRKLRGMAPADLASLLTEIAGAAERVSRQGTIPEQVAELVRWAESTNGPGLRVIEETLADF